MMVLRWPPLRVCSFLFAANLIFIVASDADAQTVTLGAGVNFDASLDDGLNDRWEDTTAATPFDLRLDTPAVNYVTGVSGLPGITGAYEFSGGATGNNAGAIPSTIGTTNQRSFQEAPGNWSDEAVSIEIWFKPDNISPSTTNGQILFEDGGGNGLGFFVDGDEIRLRTESGGGNVAYNLNTDPSGLLSGSATSEFIQIVGTFDPGPNPDNLELFVNGQSVGTGTTGNQNDWSGGDAAGIGTRGDANVGGIGGGQQNTESFDGQIAIFRAYRNQILSAGDVANNYNAVLNNAPQPILGGLLEYDARVDDGANSTWENTGAIPGFNGSISATGQTYNGSPSTSLPGVTAAYEFDGTGGTTLGNLEGLEENQSASFEVLFRPSDLSGSEVIFETGGGTGVSFFLGGGNNPDAELAALADSDLSFSVTQNSFGNQTAFVSTDLTSIGTDEFIHAIGVLDIATDEVTLYVNGVEVGSDIALNNISDWTGGDAAGLGLVAGSNMGGIGSGDQGFDSFQGDIGLFRILGRALTPEEVQLRFDALSVGNSVVPEPGSVAVWAVLGLFAALLRRRSRKS